MTHTLTHLNRMLKRTQISGLLNINMQNLTTKT